MQGEEVGKISKKWGGILKEVFTDADSFGITFPVDLDVKIKAVLMAAAILIVNEDTNTFILLKTISNKLKELIVIIYYYRTLCFLKTILKSNPTRPNFFVMGNKPEILNSHNQNRSTKNEMPFSIRYH